MVNGIKTDKCFLNFYLETDAKGSGLTGIVTLGLREQLWRKQIMKLKVFSGDFITSKGVMSVSSMQATN